MNAFMLKERSGKKKALHRKKNSLFLIRDDRVKYNG